MARRRRRRRGAGALIAVVLVIVAGNGPGAAAGRAARLRDRDHGPRWLETGRVGGLTVLTDAEGYTLYWFGPDNATISACEASCARTWPPVTAPAVKGRGSTGTLGAIARPDGSLQATYDGHPLYTTSADRAGAGQGERRVVQWRPVARGRRGRRPGPATAAAPDSEATDIEPRYGTPGSRAEPEVP